MSNIFEGNGISGMSVSVVTIPVSMKAICEGIVEVLKMLKFFVKNTVFLPKKWVKMSKLLVNAIAYV